MSGSRVDSIKPKNKFGLFKLVGGGGGVSPPGAGAGSEGGGEVGAVCMGWGSI